LTNVYEIWHIYREIPDQCNVSVFDVDDGSQKKNKSKRRELKADVDEGLTVFIR